MDQGRALNRRRGLLVLTAAPIGFVALLYALPMVQVLRRSAATGAVREVLGDDRIRQIAWFTLWQAAISTLAVLVLGIPLAGLLARRSFPGRHALAAVVAAPFTLPTVVVGAAFLALLPATHRHGVLAIVAAHTFFNLGLVVRVAGPVWEAQDPHLTEAATTLGASPLRAWWSVTLPAIAPALAGAAALAFTLCATSYGTVLLLGGPTRSTIDVEIHRQTVDLLRLDRAAVLAVAEVLVLGAVLAATTVLLGRVDPVRRLTTTARPLRGARERSGAALVVCSALLLIGAPLVVLVTDSLRNTTGGYGLDAYRALLHVTPGTGFLEPPMHSVLVSLRTAVPAAALAILIGLCAATVVSARRSRLSRALDAALLLPLATSAVTLGLGFLLAFARPPLAWRSTWFAVPLVQSVVCLPFVTRAILPSLRAVDPRLREAAATLGASPWRAWLDVDARLAARALGAASGLAVAVALGEFGATSFLARPQSATVPIAIARLSGRPGAVVQTQATALAVVLAAITVAVLAVTGALRVPRPRTLDVREERIGS